MSREPGESRIPAVEVVQLSPPGRGAIAALRIEGPEAMTLVRGLVRLRGHAASGPLPVGRIALGRIGSEPGEEVVVCRRGDASIELHCHGGRLAVEVIRAELLAAGARGVSWDAWATRHHQDPITAAAHIALAEARTERTAAILLDQYQGALRRELDQVDEAMGKNDMPIARTHIDTLLARAPLGRHLTRPWRVVLGGPENAGKSSLLNALIGYPRAIVHHVPGTTRDVVRATTAIDGWPIEFCDTAGLAALEGSETIDHRDSGVETDAGAASNVQEEGQSLRRAGIELASRQLAAADLVVLVFDGSRPWSRADAAVFDTRRNALIVHNKSDLPLGGGARPPGHWASALTGNGVEPLAAAIAGRLVPTPPPSGAAVPFTDDQIERLVGLAET